MCLLMIFLSFVHVLFPSLLMGTYLHGRRGFSAAPPSATVLGHGPHTHASQWNDLRAPLPFRLQGNHFSQPHAVLSQRTPADAMTAAAAPAPPPKTSSF